MFYCSEQQLKLFLFSYFYILFSLKLFNYLLLCLDYVIMFNFSMKIMYKRHFNEPHYVPEVDAIL